MKHLLGLWIAEVWAAGSGAEEAHGVAWFQLIFPLVNFLIFAYLVKRYLLPVMRNYLSERRSRVVNAVREAEQEHARAEAMVRDYRDRLAGLEAETRELREMLRQEGDRLRAKLVAEAEELAAKIKADAGFLADQEVKAGRQQLRSELAALAHDQAAELLRRQLSPEDQRRLVEEFVHGVEGVR
ncbi:MAG: ATP synthase F0 subunit B [Deltaproteobacteria bacterium]|nr:ATP synthase F0 subunit B [Deltaproteobacteria bacterium]